MRTIEEIKKAIGIHILVMGVDGFNAKYIDPVTQKEYYVVCSWGMGWEHVSISNRTKIPSWEIMCRIKEIFFKDEEWCVEYHPAKSEYINNMATCLHIWRPISKKLPTPPSIMVGLKGIGPDEIGAVLGTYLDNAGMDKNVEMMKKKYAFKPNRAQRKIMKKARNKK
jgi:hypothetical protein